MKKHPYMHIQHSEQDVDLQHDTLPDPIEEQIQALQRQVATLRRRLDEREEEDVYSLSVWR